ncbi:MAG: CinA family protein [Eubacteriales bacterium]|nr:CinA family protein [Eubacteriales bacterium]
MKSEEKLIEVLTRGGLKLSVAESLTGGLIGASIVNVPGASTVFEGGFITYTEKAKTTLVGVQSESIEKYTVVSSQVATEMARGALLRLKTDIAVSVTGLAGPGGGSPLFPVGLVFVGIATKNGVTAYKCNFDGDRQKIREMTKDFAIAKATEVAEQILLGKD